MGVPAAVGEIAFGIIVGPQVLEIVSETEFFSFLAEFGFAFLMFLAGLELDFANLERKGPRVVFLSGIVASLIIGLAFLAAFRMGWSPFFWDRVGSNVDRARSGDSPGNRCCTFRLRANSHTGRVYRRVPDNRHRHPIQHRFPVRVWIGVP